MQIKGEGDRSHRPVGAAAAKTHHAPLDHLRSRTPLARATGPSVPPPSRTAPSRSCDGSSAGSGSRPPRCGSAGPTGGHRGRPSGSDGPRHPQRISRDRLRVVIGATPRRPQAGAARPQAWPIQADMTRPLPAQPPLVCGPFTLHEDEVPILTVRHSARQTLFPRGEVGRRPGEGAKSPGLTGFPPSWIWWSSARSLECGLPSITRVVPLPGLGGAWIIQGQGKPSESDRKEQGHANRRRPRRGALQR